MELLQSAISQGPAAVGAPPFVARYRPVMWEPVPGTGERLVALVAVQAHESTEQAVAPGTYNIISDQRLRQLLGRQRGAGAAGILKQSAEFMTQRQQAGLPLEDLRPLFRGFEIGPVMVARAYSVQQLLDAAVRSVSAFGSADEMIEEEEARQSPRHMVRTAEFLTQLRRIFTANSKDLSSRFDVPLHGPGDVPSVVIDYADGALAVQVTSLPSTAKQAEHTEREAQSKMFELDIARNQMAGNVFRPTLLFNTDALAEEASAEARKHAEGARVRLANLARYKNIAVLEAQSPSVAARLLDDQAG
jgi:hypothetical protein